MSFEELLAEFKTHVWPHVEYAAGVLDLACESQLQRLDSFQRGFLKELNSDDRSAFLFHNFGPPTIRRRIAVLIFLHCQDNQGAKVFDDRLNDVIWYSLRLYSRTLFGMMRFYNTLPHATRSLSSVSVFQSQLTAFVRSRAETDNDSWRTSLNPRFHFVSGRPL